MGLNNLKQMVEKEINSSTNEATEAVSKGFRITIEFFGIVGMIWSYNASFNIWAKVILFLISAFLYIRGRQLD